jgi:hypothetical protein
MPPPKRGHSPTSNRFKTLETDMDTNTDAAGAESSAGPGPKTTLKDAIQSAKTNLGDETSRILTLILKQMNETGAEVKQCVAATNRMSESMASVIDQLANLQLQMTAIKEENEMLKTRLDQMEEKLTNMKAKEETALPTHSSYAAAAKLPPRPPKTSPHAHVNIVKHNETPAKLAAPLHSRASREVTITFANAADIDRSHESEDNALKITNAAMLKSPLKKRPFSAARFSIAGKLILTTGPQDNNEEL